jgi:hypothetical protein
MAILPATGSAIAMGQVYTAYSNAAHTAGTNIRLSATLGATYGGKVAGAAISFSSTFGGKTTPYGYPN